jgi:hypothetical protein
MYGYNKYIVLFTSSLDVHLFDFNLYASCQVEPFYFVLEKWYDLSLVI